MRRGPVWLGLAISLLILLAANLAARQQGASGKTASGTAKGAASADLPLIDLAGYNQALAKYKGKPILVTFWATWCEPCRDEYPMIVELEKQYSSQGLAVFGVDMDDTAEMNLVRRFLARNQPRFPNYRQKPGIDLDAFYHGVNPAWTGSMPETVFYGRDGRIAGHFVGERSRASFEQAIHSILAESAVPKTGK
ncbi:MAG TPA: TlpA disulfide reductase family protein [Candidatus Limnocylindria bacterium]|nr:TlpA disulfide reductase family protein [Candidatus Limnocylindria bacterium]